MNIYELTKGLEQIRKINEDFDIKSIEFIKPNEILVTMHKEGDLISHCVFYSLEKRRADYADQKEYDCSNFISVEQVYEEDGYKRNGNAIHNFFITSRERG